MMSMEEHIGNWAVVIKILVLRLGGEVIITEGDITSVEDYVIDGQEDPKTGNAVVKVKLPLTDGGPAPTLPEER